MNRSRLWAIAGFVVLSLCCLGIGLGLRVYSSPEWMALDTMQKPPGLHPWAVEADCYSQLARVQRILHGQGLIQSHFAVENWPEGLTPSTTAPFDYAILLLLVPLWPFTVHPLDWAGALVSPALWAALVVFWMLIRSREFTYIGRALLLAGSAAMPAIIWATAFGRPRHQSLILALMAMGLTAEYERWQIELVPKRAWNIFAGIAWGLACWTSLFEPAVVVTALVIFNLIVRRRENVAFLASFGVVVVIYFILEGTHTLTASALLIHPPAEYQEALLRWLSTIAEVRPNTIAGIVHQMTLVLFLLPFLAWRVWPRENGNKTDALMILLTFFLTIFALFQCRWIYYASLAELMLIVRYFQAAPTRWTRITVVAFFLFSLLSADWEGVVNRPATAPNQPSLQIAQISRAIDGPGGIMAPWWFSPGLLYFSGQPIVGGSSHCGISGIVATAKFFSSGSWIDAERILRERKVRWVVAWDDQTIYNGEQFVYPLLNSSRQILGEPALGDDDKAEAESTVAQVLAEDRDVPTWLKLRGVTDQFKLYEYIPAGQ